MASNVIYIERELLKSPLYWSLPKSAQRVFITFLLKRRMGKVSTGSRGKQWDTLNNGELIFTYSEAKKEMGMPAKTFRDAIDKLVDHGFIDIFHQGSGGVKGDVSLYAISERWRNYGTDKFVKKTRTKDGKKGTGFMKMWEAKKKNIGNQKVSYIANQKVSPLEPKRGRVLTKRLVHKNKETG